MSKRQDGKKKLNPKDNGNNKNNKLPDSNDSDLKLSNSTSLVNDSDATNRLNVVTKENDKLKRDLSRVSYQLRVLKKNMPADRAEMEFKICDYSPVIQFEPNRLRVVNLKYNESRNRTISIIEHLNNYNCPDLYSKLGLNNLINGYESLSVVYMLFSYFKFIISLYDDVRYDTNITYVSNLSKFFDNSDMIYLKNHFAEIRDDINLSEYDKIIIDSYNKLRFKFVGSIDSFILPTYEFNFNGQDHIIGKDVKEDYVIFKQILQYFRNPDLPIFHMNRLFNDYAFTLDGDVLTGKNIYYEPTVVNGYKVNSITVRERESKITFYTSSDNTDLKFIPRDSLVEGKFSLYLKIYDCDIEVNDYHDHIVIENGSNTAPDVKNYIYKFRPLVNSDLELNKIDSYLIYVNQENVPFLYPSMMQLFIPGAEVENIGSVRMNC